MVVGSHLFVTVSQLFDDSRLLVELATTSSDFDHNEWAKSRFKNSISNGDDLSANQSCPKQIRFINEIRFKKSIIAERVWLGVR